MKKGLVNKTTENHNTNRGGDLSLAGMVSLHLAIQTYGHTTGEKKKPRTTPTDRPVVGRGRTSRIRRADEATGVPCPVVGDEISEKKTLPQNTGPTLIPYPMESPHLSLSDTSL